MPLSRRSPKRTAALAAGVAGLASVFIVGTASPALANSFSGTDGYASWSYNDGTDSFCVTAKIGSPVVKLSPVTAGRGPSYNTSVPEGTKRCFSLARAYEDSKYRWGVGTRGAYNSGTFFS